MRNGRVIDQPYSQRMYDGGGAAQSSLGGPRRGDEVSNQKYNAGTLQSPPTMSVHELLDTELKSLAATHETVSQLEQRLGTVLESVPAASCVGAESSSSPYTVVDKVRNLVDITHLLDSRLQSILQRINL